jgi:hypothetical protein
MKRTISGILVTTLVLTALPAWAADSSNLSRPSGTDGPGTFRLSVDRALAAVMNAPTEPATQLQASQASETATQSGQARQSAQQAATGKAGGHTMATIMTVVGVVGGIVGTAYTIKMMKKATEQTKP